jgi:hypothetical protein
MQRASHLVALYLASSMISVLLPSHCVGPRPIGVSLGA